MDVGDVGPSLTAGSGPKMAEEFSGSALGSDVDRGKAFEGEHDGEHVGTAADLAVFGEALPTAGGGVEVDLVRLAAEGTIKLEGIDEHAGFRPLRVRVKIIPASEGA